MRPDKNPSTKFIFFARYIGSHYSGLLRLFITPNIVLITKKGSDKRRVGHAF